MSYDLYFYKKKTSNLTESQIADYLTFKLSPSSLSGNKQWFVDDKLTEVYYSIDHNEPKTDDESIKLFESLDDYENTHFTFSLNYIRPDFFGRGPFDFFIKRLIIDLDLYVLNPQSITNSNHPIKPKENELYENWSQINEIQSANLFYKNGLEYYPLDKSNEFYNYNSNIFRLQADLNEIYSIPKLYLYKKKYDGQLITICEWVECTPSVFPSADYFILIKKYEEKSKLVEEVGLISSDTFNERFESFITNFKFENCKIIHPKKAGKAKDIFNATKIEHNLSDFAVRVPIDKLVNVKPNE